MSNQRDERIRNSLTRSPIHRSSGITETERHLATLADRSFLNLWSYPNLFRDQRESPTAGGKELCDLLVVCGNDILIFSEKHVAWPDKKLEVAWPRWFKKAVKKSVDQVLGAERWITKFPEQIFLDSKCEQPFPISIPPPEKRRIHGVVVARGAGEACKSYFNGGTGSFLIDMSIEGDAHWNSDRQTLEPFSIGNLNPGGTFIHVLDDGSLDILMSELDTITDFTKYLTKKETFLRSQHFGYAHGEEDLYAYYAFHMNKDDEHDFVGSEEDPWPSDKKIAIDGSHYTGMLQNTQYFLKKQADEVSYAWDKLILNFTSSIMDGTSTQPKTEAYDFRMSEIAVREMALESRFERRHIGASIVEAIKNFDVENHDAFIRQILPSNIAKRSTGFFFYITNFRTWGKDRTYEDYKKARNLYAELYAKAILIRHTHLQKVVGISVQAPFSEGSSEDLIYMEIWDYSPDEVKEVEEACERLGIMRSESPLKPLEGNEFPDAPDNAVLISLDPAAKTKSYPSDEM